MKICVAQTKPITGNIAANIEAHKKFIELALTLNAAAIFFPELSLTGYEPELAKKLATHQNDPRLDIFQQISDINNIIIGVGLPTLSEIQVRISMIIFEPNKPRQTYSKQILHSDEFPYFQNGVEQVIIKLAAWNIAPAICYESLQPTHEKAFDYYPTIAKQYAMPVLMSNAVGFCDNFLSVGKSAVWTKKGELAGQLDDKMEGILIFDTATEEIVLKHLNN